MENFDYLAPRSLTEAYAALGSGRTSLMLAGGTDVIVQLREGRKRCDQLIDLKHIPELMSYGFAADGTLEIGAAVPLAQLYEDPEVRRRQPALCDAATIIGGTAIQSRATLGGNLCNASPAADSSPALIALGALLVIGSDRGTGEVPVEAFFAGPGRSSLQPGEILLQVRVPALGAREGAYYHRFIPRNEMDIAVVNAATYLAFDGDVVTEARFALGAVAATPLSVPAAAEAVVGRRLTDETIAAAAEAARQTATPISDMRGTVRQRKHLVGVLTEHVIRRAVARARA